MSEVCEVGEGRGVKVISAGAGGCGASAGMVAANTNLPVIGVPVESSALSGLDSLLSIVQMPRGVPVATVAIGEVGRGECGVAGGADRGDVRRGGFCGGGGTSGVCEAEVLEGTYCGDEDLGE